MYLYKVRDVKIKYKACKSNYKIDMSVCNTYPEAVVMTTTQEAAIFFMWPFPS